MKRPIRYILCTLVSISVICFLPNSIVSSFAKEFNFQWTANHTNDDVDFYRIYWSRNYGEYGDPEVQGGMKDVDDLGVGVKYGAVYDQVIDNISYDIPVITESGLDSIACFAATAVDLNGYESDYSDQLCHGPVIPPFVVTAANQSSYTLTGWAYPGAAVYIYPEGASGNDYIGFTTAQSDGSWTATGLDLSFLPEGEVTLYVKSNNTSGPYATGIKDSATSKFTAGPGASGITETSAIIAWSTNELTSSILEYRTADQSLPPEEQISGQLSDSSDRDHSMQITGLVPGRAYYYSIRATDGAGNVLISNERLFWTLDSEDSTPPVVTQPSDDGNPSETGATISWYVNEWCVSELQCRVDDGASPYITKQIIEGQGDRTANLDGLIPDETYICRVLATDASGNGPVTSQESDPFTTQIDDRDPVIDEATIDVTVDDRSATIIWQTDEDSTSVVEYWTAISPVQTEPSEPVYSYVKNHLVILVALSESTTYNFRVISTDDAAVPNTASSSVKTFTTLATPDITDPEFDELPTVNVTDNTATISWVSNEETTGSVQYGLSESNWDKYTHSKDGIVLKTVHSVTLTELDKGEQYHFRVGITDGSENGPIVSDDYSFFIESDQDITAPVFDQWPTVTSITSDSAVIQWSTDENSTSIVRYDLDGSGPYYWDEELSPVSNYSYLVNDAVLTRDHFVTLTNLAAGTKYRAMVGSTDIWNNGPTKSWEFSFTTNTAPDEERPRITEPPTVTSITRASVTIYWETDEPANGVVRYGFSRTTWGEYLYEVINSQVGTDHTIVLNNLFGGQRYYFRVGSTDAAGNGPEKMTIEELAAETNNPFTEDIFMTEDIPDVIPPRIIGGPQTEAVDANSAIISWETDEPSNSAVKYKPDDMTWAELTLSASDGAMVTDHSITLTGLNDSQAYDYYVESIDGSENGPTTSAMKSFTTLDYPDTTAPTISDVEISKTTNSTLLITWTTDEPANSLVQYIASSTISWGDDQNTAESDAGLYTNHSVTITNLADNTLYAFMVASIDVKGNGPPYVIGIQNPSDPQTIRTDVDQDIQAPQIIEGTVNIKEGQLTAEGKRTVVVTWETDEPGNSQVQYDGISSSWGGYSFAENEAGLVTSHRVVLTNLDDIIDAGLCSGDPCVFYYRVSSTDASGNNHETNILCPIGEECKYSVIDANPSEEDNFVLQKVVESGSESPASAVGEIQEELEEMATCFIQTSRAGSPIGGVVLTVAGILAGVFGLLIIRMRKSR